ncbi:hypothetical protein LTR53_003594 [Teratosphaeriaceae sp. CCFEE 6253]|nr:hypothetical protein LTR53_003594 [Teratosphaeriaceae sp. CCFEE 6253]
MTLVSAPDLPNASSLLNSSIGSTGPWIDHSSFYGLYPTHENEPDHEFITRRSAIDHLLAGRDSDTTFRDLRSGAKPRLRRRKRFAKYHNYRIMHHGQVGRPHHDLGTWYPHYPSWGGAELVPDCPLVTLTKREIWNQTRIHTRNRPSYGNGLRDHGFDPAPDLTEYYRSRSKRRVVKPNAHRYREIQDLMYEGKEEGLQYLASGGDLSRFYRSREVVVNRSVYYSDEPNSSTPPAHFEDTWAHGLADCDVEAGETCRQHIADKCRLVANIWHVGSASGPRLLSSDLDYDWYLWDPAPEVQPALAGTASLATYMCVKREEIGASEYETGPDGDEWQECDVSVAGSDWEKRDSGCEWEMA